MDLRTEWWKGDEREQRSKDVAQRKEDIKYEAFNRVETRSAAATGDALCFAYKKIVLKKKILNSAQRVSLVLPDRVPRLSCSRCCSSSCCYDDFFVCKTIIYLADIVWYFNLQTEAKPSPRVVCSAVALNTHTKNPQHDVSVWSCQSTHSPPPFFDMKEILMESLLLLHRSAAPFVRASIGTHWACDGVIKGTISSVPH